MDVRRSALVAHPAQRLYTLIEAAEDYPKFLPWCASATILERDAGLVSARIEVAWRGVRFGFVTVNEKRFPHWMSIRLAQGPFRRFEGEWRLTPLADWGCRVEFRLAYEFNAALLGPLAAPVFAHVTDTLVDAFVRRADELGAGLTMPLATAPAAAPPIAPPAVPLPAGPPPAPAPAVPSSPPMQE
ncbi:MAG: type II toxin-antitoxin system RatA family toxin [Rubrivivax sp.]